MIKQSKYIQISDGLAATRTARAQHVVDQMNDKAEEIEKRAEDAKKRRGTGKRQTVADIWRPDYKREKLIWIKCKETSMTNRQLNVYK